MMMMMRMRMMMMMRRRMTMITMHADNDHNINHNYIGVFTLFACINCVYNKTKQNKTKQCTNLGKLNNYKYK
jgi:hypothetical protein